ncbi:arginine--tRNA ligase [Fodinicurvata sediminis]|uniref:arginine--tRNA ligase n=1 Tax=Fodinicurvata sediminis TaxID=1121832 RepID=UPI000401794D|nr:arginine--tRNA ligase [Fodinicurvata sediminis]
MNIFSTFEGSLRTSIESLGKEGSLPSSLDLTRVTVEPPRDPDHGDLSTNAAMVLAKQAGQKPRELADMIADRLRGLEGVEAVEIAGPGFINLRLTDAYWHSVLSAILATGEAYGASRIGEGQSVNVEYVSANPTGPLTVGHARGAVVGDALASLLQKTGHRVTREYYVNDAGGQVDTLARSVHLRYREALGEEIGEIPEGMYPGAYLRDVGQALVERDGRKWAECAESEWLGPVRSFAVDHMMALIREDLKAVGIEHDVIRSEKELVEDGAVQAVVDRLKEKDLLYTGVLEPPKGKKPEDWEPRPQTLFRATDFGDDVDRPILKSDGSWTYFANDMAYHLDKANRGSNTLIDVLGADHGGYVKRMKAAIKALTDDSTALHIILCQLVKLTRDGEEIKMSKRSGNFITLREVVDEVGKDVLRFIMLTRKNDAPLDFDLARVMEESKDNPVFYVQYAHARIRSVLRHAERELPSLGQGLSQLSDAPLHRLTDSAELAVIKRLANWPRLVEASAQAYEPHRIAFYLNDLASDFHGLWTKGKDNEELRFLLPADPELTQARLAMLQAVALVIASGLKIFGVRPVEEMR